SSAPFSGGHINGAAWKQLTVTSLGQSPPPAAHPRWVTPSARWISRCEINSCCVPLRSELAATASASCQVRNTIIERAVINAKFAALLELSSATENEALTGYIVIASCDRANV